MATLLFIHPKNKSRTFIGVPVLHVEGLYPVLNLVFADHLGYKTGPFALPQVWRYKS
jgi:hypothetical protein